MVVNGPKGEKKNWNLNNEMGLTHELVVHKAILISI